MIITFHVLKCFSLAFELVIELPSLDSLSKFRLLATNQFIDYKQLLRLHSELLHQWGTVYLFFPSAAVTPKHLLSSQNDVILVIACYSASLFAILLPVLQFSLMQLLLIQIAYMPSFSIVINCNGGARAKGIFLLVFFRSSCGRNCWNQNATVLSIWGHSQHSLQDGIYQ